MVPGHLMQQASVCKCTRRQPQHALCSCKQPCHIVGSTGWGFTLTLPSPCPYSTPNLTLALYPKHASLTRVWLVKTCRHCCGPGSHSGADCRAPGIAAASPPARSLPAHPHTTPSQRARQQTPRNAHIRLGCTPALPGSLDACATTRQRTPN